MSNVKGAVENLIDEITLLIIELGVNPQEFPEYHLLIAKMKSFQDTVETFKDKFKNDNNNSTGS